MRILVRDICADVASIGRAKHKSFIGAGICGIDTVDVVNQVRGKEFSITGLLTKQVLFRAAMRINKYYDYRINHFIMDKVIKNIFDLCMPEIKGTILKINGWVFQKSQSIPRYILI